MWGAHQDGTVRVVVIVLLERPGRSPGLFNPVNVVLGGFTPGQLLSMAA
jgi:hypothetical protein